MKLITPTRKSSSDDNLIPLINIVFLMLIFFMIAGQIEATMPLKVTPPAAGNEQSHQEADFTIFIDADGRLAFENELLSLEELTLTLRQQQIKDAHLALKADADLAVSRLSPVIDLLRETGAAQVTLYTQRSATDALPDTSSSTATGT